MPETRDFTTKEVVSNLLDRVEELGEEVSQQKLRNEELQKQLESLQLSQLSQQSGSTKEDKMLGLPLSCVGPSTAGLITSFSGKATEDVTVFINDVLATAELCAWSDETCLRMAKLRLTGDAKTYVLYHEELSKASTFHALAEGLRQRYRKQNSARFHREKLNSLVQKPNESVESFSDRIRLVNVQTYELTGVAAADKEILREAENRLLDVFLRGIPAEFSRRVRMENPVDLAAALRVATYLEEVDIATKVRSEKKLFASEKTCFRCGKKGHVKSQCRQPQCFNCSGYGHKASNCDRKKQGKQPNSKQALNANGSVSTVVKHFQ